jgi:hypothetical protein
MLQAKKIDVYYNRTADAENLPRTLDIHLL